MNRRTTNGSMPFLYNGNDNDGQGRMPFLFNEDQDDTYHVGVGHHNGINQDDDSSVLPEEPPVPPNTPVLRPQSNVSRPRPEHVMIVAAAMLSGYATAAPATDGENDGSTTQVESNPSFATLANSNETTNSANGGQPETMANRASNGVNGGNDGIGGNTANTANTANTVGGGNGVNPINEVHVADGGTTDNGGTVVNGPNTVNSVSTLNGVNTVNSVNTLNDVNTPNGVETVNGMTDTATASPTHIQFLTIDEGHEADDEAEEEPAYHGPYFTGQIGNYRFVEGEVVDNDPYTLILRQAVEQMENGTYFTPRPSHHAGPTGINHVGNSPASRISIGAGHSYTYSYVHGLPFVPAHAPSSSHQSELWNVVSPMAHSIGTRRSSSTQKPVADKPASPAASLATLAESNPAPTTAAGMDASTQTNEGIIADVDHHNIQACMEPIVPNHSKLPAVQSVVSNGGISTIAATRTGFGSIKVGLCISIPGAVITGLIAVVSTTVAITKAATQGKTDAGALVSLSLNWVACVFFSAVAFGLYKRKACSADVEKGIELQPMDRKAVTATQSQATGPQNQVAMPRTQAIIANTGVGRAIQAPRRDGLEDRQAAEADRWWSRFAQNGDQVREYVEALEQRTVEAERNLSDYLVAVAVNTNTDYRDMPEIYGRSACVTQAAGPAHHSQHGVHRQSPNASHVTRSSIDIMSGRVPM